MSKRQHYYAQCERGFVEESMSFVELSKRYPVSDKQLRTWADDGNWRERKAALMKRQDSISEKLHEIVDRLSDSVLKDLQGDQPIDTGRLYALEKLADKLKKVREYEKDAKADNAPVGDGKGGASEDVLRKLEQQLKIL
jgi:hypothetical protein